MAKEERENIRRLFMVPYFNLINKYDRKNKFCSYKAAQVVKKQSELLTP
jgi:hypothetical protein